MMKRGKWRAKWTPQEHLLAERLKREGMTNKEIAVAIGRTHCAVISWSTARGRRERAAREVREAVRMLIRPDDVIAYYELGWRFVGFEGALCAFEWQSTREPQWPVKTATYSSSSSAQPFAQFA